MVTHLTSNNTVLEVGCGVGWLSSSIAYHYKCKVTAIDFNPVAIERANKINDAIQSTVDFQVQDLFLYESKEPFDVVISMGVLHHTDNCHAALEHIFDRLLKPGGYALIGLYHSYGRKPFLDHFSNMKAEGASEEKILGEYKRLHSALTDETHIVSWFRDQVLHPHETQHTIAEMLPLMDKHDVKLVSTSINRFKPFSSTDELIDLEFGMEQVGIEKIRTGEYYPGFFIFLCRKVGGE